jgi:hypothetical protein
MLKHHGLGIGWMGELRFYGFRSSFVATLSPRLDIGGLHELRPDVSSNQHNVETRKVFASSLGCVTISS